MTDEFLIGRPADIPFEDLLRMAMLKDQHEIRPMIKYIKDNNSNDPLTGCEIGVWQGNNALSILTNLNIETLYLVDPWKKHRIHNNRLFSQDKMDIVLMKAVARLMPFEDKWRMIRTTSSEGVKHVPDNLDFLYIDTLHTYKSCKQDIGFWYPKVKPGGVFGGHDYDNCTMGVVVAVDEFVEANNLELHQNGMDWWIVKKFKLEFQSNGVDK